MLTNLIFLQAIAQDNCDKHFVKDPTNFYDSKILITNWMPLDNKKGAIKIELLNKKIEISYASNSKDVKSTYNKIVLSFNNGISDTIRATRSGSDVFEPTDGIPFKWKNQYLGSLVLLKLFSSYELINITEISTKEVVSVASKNSIIIKEIGNCFLNKIDTTKDIQAVYLERRNDDCDYFQYEKDNFSGNLRKRVAYTTIGFQQEANEYNSQALVASLFNFENKTGFDIRLNSISYCINDDSYIMIKLKNAEIIKIVNSAGIKCEKGSTFTCYLNKEISDKLKQDKIEVIRLMTTDGFIDIENISYPDYFVKNINCLF